MIKTRSSALYCKVLQILLCIVSVSQCWEALHWLPLVISRFPSITIVYFTFPIWIHLFDSGENPVKSRFGFWFQLELDVSLESMFKSVCVWVRKIRCENYKTFSEKTIDIFSNRTLKMLPGVLNPTVEILTRNCNINHRLLRMPAAVRSLITGQHDQFLLTIHLGKKNVLNTYFKYILI